MRSMTRWAISIGAFVIGVGVSAGLGVVWSPICHESCLFSVGLSMLIFVALLPFAISTIVFWALGSFAAKRRVVPAIVVVLLLALALTVAAFLARGHAHGG